MCKNWLQVHIYKEYHMQSMSGGGGAHSPAGEGWGSPNYCMTTGEKA